MEVLVVGEVSSSDQSCVSARFACDKSAVFVAHQSLWTLAVWSPFWWFVDVTSRLVKVTSRRTGWGRRAFFLGDEDKLEEWRLWNGDWETSLYQLVDGKWIDTR